MTKLRTHRLFTFLPAQSWNGSSGKKPSLPAMICIVVLFCAAAAIASPAQSVVFTTLANFDGANGANPGNMAFVLGTDGNFYGTTEAGGIYDSECVSGSCGTVFRITREGALTTLYSFCAQPGCLDGSFPIAGLVQGSDGNFYGTTELGGTGSWAAYGTVFKISREGALTTLYSFCSQRNCVDGLMPVSPLLQGTDGNFYGTTVGGGAGNCPDMGCGTVFKITSSGALTTLYGFHGADGTEPDGGLVQGRDGNFYGTTHWGGSSAHPWGTVFKISPAGALTTLYSFCSQPNCTDGDQPLAGLVQASDGNFYGTTAHGGASGDHGTVFKITPAGELTSLYSFCSQPNCRDGDLPVAGLVQASDGNFYGTTYSGGSNSNCSNGCGTVFKITPAGALTTLHSFNSTDGANPYGGLVQAPNGFFYGTTSAGGSYGSGTVFRLAVVRACATCGP